MRSLPTQLRERIEEVTTILEKRPNAGLVRAGVEADTLGLFDGHPFPDAQDMSGEVSPTITLFLCNIWDDSGRRIPEYRDQVRRTVLHELGHFLGLEESDLVARNVD